MVGVSHQSSVLLSSAQVERCKIVGNNFGWWVQLLLFCFSFSVLIGSFSFILVKKQCDTQKRTWLVWLLVSHCSHSRTAPSRSAGLDSSISTTSYPPNCFTGVNLRSTRVSGTSLLSCSTFSSSPSPPGSFSLPFSS